MGILGTLLKIGACFDWITPMIDLAQQRPAFSGWDAFRVARNHGIRTHEEMEIEGELYFSVSPEDAERLKRLLG